MAEVGVGYGVDRVRDVLAELKYINGRLRLEFSEIRDRLRQLDQRLDGLGDRLDRLEASIHKETAD